MGRLIQRLRTGSRGQTEGKLSYDLWVNGSVSDRLGGAVALLLFLHRRERALGRSKGQRREGEGRLRTRLFRTRPLALRARCLGLFRSTQPAPRTAGSGDRAQPVATELISRSSYHVR
jgi:hypothetical protein